MSIHIGAHPSNLTLTALAHEPGLQEKLRRSGLDIVFPLVCRGTSDPSGAGSWGD